MRVRLMQIIDYWVGVPLCFLFTFVDLVLKRLHPWRPNDPKKILFIELSEMGSAIIAYSTLMQAKQKYPNASLYFLIFKKNAESCQILNLIPNENILTIDDKSFLRFAFSTIKMLLYIRKLKVDTAIDLELFSRCTALITYLSGATNRIGFHRGTNEGLYRGKLITHVVPYNSHQHIALNFLALLASLEEPRNQVPLVKRDVRGEIINLPHLKFSTSEQAWADELLRNEKSNYDNSNELIIFNPDPGDALPIRGWPLDRFIEVAKSLLEHDQKRVIAVIGLKGSKRYAQAMQQALPDGRCIDLTGKTPTLRSVTCLLDRAKLLVTNDSGPAHLAALSGTATVVLFGPETPALYGPLNDRAISLFADFSCSPCLSALNHRYTICNDNLCLKAIKTEEVLKAANDLLFGKSHDHRRTVLRIVNN